MPNSSKPCGSLPKSIMQQAKLCAQQVWPYSAGWGYYPGGGLGLILLVLIVLIVLGRI
jgi:hypothetical protein